MKIKNILIALMLSFILLFQGCFLDTESEATGKDITNEINQFTGKPSLVSIDYKLKSNMQEDNKDYEEYDVKKYYKVKIASNGSNFDIKVKPKSKSKIKGKNDSGFKFSSEFNLDSLKEFEIKSRDGKTMISTSPIRDMILEESKEENKSNEEMSQEDKEKINKVLDMIPDGSYITLEDNQFLGMILGEDIGKATIISNSKLRDEVIKFLDKVFDDYESKIVLKNKKGFRIDTDYWGIKKEFINISQYIKQNEEKFKNNMDELIKLIYDLYADEGEELKEEDIKEAKDGIFDSLKDALSEDSDILKDVEKFDLKLEYNRENSEIKYNLLKIKNKIESQEIVSIKIALGNVELKDFTGKELDLTEIFKMMMGMNENEDKDENANMDADENANIDENEDEDMIIDKDESEDEEEDVDEDKYESEDDENVYDNEDKEIEALKNMGYTDIKPIVELNQKKVTSNDFSYGKLENTNMILLRIKLKNDEESEKIKKSLINFEKENNIEGKGSSVVCLSYYDKGYSKCNITVDYEGEADFSKFKYEIK